MGARRRPSRDRPAFHYCRPDRLHEPTIVACANFGSGLRVFDIRDPARPAEIAYYNAGTVGSDPPVADWAVSPPASSPVVFESAAPPAPGTRQSPYRGAITAVR
jgi:hypothetical protein